MLWLELEGRGCYNVFDPQLEFVRNCNLYAAQMLQGQEKSDFHETLQLRHVVFRKVRYHRVHKDPKGLTFTVIRLDAR